ncbi:MAG: DinB family protein [Bacteroidota bacterium]
MKSSKLSIDKWVDELDRYSEDQLVTQPASGTWSIGQLYLHLLDDTAFYVTQIHICVSTNEFADEKMSDFGLTLFASKSFPDQRIEGASSNASIPQPANKETIRKRLRELRSALQSAETMLLETNLHGKTKHPGLGYFNAEEWLQFADMHFRHHLRQKKRIDAFLQLQ